MDEPYWDAEAHERADALELPLKLTMDEIAFLYAVSMVTADRTQNQTGAAEIRAHAMAVRCANVLRAQVLLAEVMGTIEKSEEV